MRIPYSPVFSPGPKHIGPNLPLTDMITNCANEQQALRLLRFEQYPVMFAGARVVFHSAHN
jgi:hypothetical protein